MLSHLTPVELSHFLLKQCLKPGGIAVDGTVGNGNDLLYLTQLAGEKGQVFGFEIQGAGLIQALNRLHEHKVNPMPTLFFGGHEQLGEKLPQSLQGKINAFIFNLGYLPGSNKKIITRAPTTLRAFSQALDWLAPEGILVAVVYRGHSGGVEESDLLLDWASQIHPTEAETHLFKRLNLRESTPYVLLIRKSPTQPKPSHG